jgi:di/tricarboxylate transporter
MSIHIIGIAGLALVFVIGSLRPVNLGALALAMTFIVGIGFGGESLTELYRGFPVDLLVLLVAVTYLFAIAARNGTIEWVVGGAARLLGGRRALVPWVVFVVAALPTTAGALGSAGVALLAPIALRLAERYDIDRRMIALMVLHGAACGNFSPLNVLGVIVHQTVARAGVEVPVASLFLGNVAYNIALGVIIYLIFGGHRLVRGVAARAIATAAPTSAMESPSSPSPSPSPSPSSSSSSAIPRVVTLAALASVAIASLAFSLSIGMPALIAAVALHLLFPASSRGAERDIAWGVVLLVCGIVTYVAVLQRVGTVDAVGHAIAGMGVPLLGALLLCAVGALTSAFASSAGILGAMMMLAVPFIAQGGVNATGFVLALAVSATVVDSCPFSTAGALVVANTQADERERVYRALLIWGAAMVLTAPLATCLFFVAFAG